MPKQKIKQKATGKQTQDLANKTKSNTKNEIHTVSSYFISDQNCWDPWNVRSLACFGCDCKIFTIPGSIRAPHSVLMRPCALCLLCV